MTVSRIAELKKVPPHTIVLNQGSSVFDHSEYSTILDIEEQIEASKALMVSATTPIGKDVILSLFGGKCVRGRMTILAANLGSQKTSVRDTVAASAAVELMHCASLVHDDILDGAIERRGRAAIHISEGMHNAILIGDYSFACAARLLAETGRADSVAVLCSALEKMVQGEFLQGAASLQTDWSFNTYREVVLNKTCALISAALRIGGIYGNCTQSECDLLSRIGEDLGLAYQILDDIADYNLDRTALGKAPGNDAVRGRITAPVIFARLKCPTVDVAAFDEAFAQVAVNENHFEQLRMLIDRYFGFAEAHNAATKLIDSAMALLMQFPESHARAALASIIISVKKPALAVPANR